MVVGDGGPIVMPSRKWGLFCVLCGAPAIFVFGHFGREDQGLTAMLSTFILIGTFRATWGLRRRRWYWPSIGVVFLVHAVVVFCFRFSHPKYALLVALPIVLVDFVLTLEAFQYLERRSVVASRDGPATKAWRLNGHVGTRLTVVASNRYTSGIALGFVPSITQPMTVMNAIARLRSAL